MIATIGAVPLIFSVHSRFAETHEAPAFASSAHVIARTFLKQAEEARETDPIRANNLAERAEVLAKDLANRLR